MKQPTRQESDDWYRNFLKKNQKMLDQIREENRKMEGK